MDQHDAFIEAIETGNLPLLRAIPKTDLHNHATKGGHPAYLGQRLGVPFPRLTKKLHSLEEAAAWWTAHVAPLVDDTRQRVLKIEACFHQAQQDGVTVLETGESVEALPERFHGDMACLIATFTRARQLHGPRVDFRFEISLPRPYPVAQLEAWIGPLLDQGCFTALDMCGDELAMPISAYKSIYRRARDKGLRLKAHVGEWGDAESVKIAVEELQLDEVQHGIAAAASPAVMRWLADHHIQLNICPTSNVMLSRVPSLEEHPIRVLFDYGVPVTINSDDVLLFGQGVSDEYLSLYRAGLFSAAELNTIRENGLLSRGVSVA